MQGKIVSLAFQGIRCKKKSSILIFIVLLLSFSFAIVSLSLVSSMSKTNEEFRLDTYGEWRFGISTGVEEDAGWLKKQSWADSIGISRSFGTVVAPAGQTGFGTVDDVLKKIGRLKLDAGEWPARDNEIAMEADTLGALGYDYSLGQEISLQVQVPCGDGYVIVERNYTLCGLIHEYSDLWVLTKDSNQRLNGAVVTEMTAKEVLKEAKSLIPSDLQDIIRSTPQYFVCVEEDNCEVALEILTDLIQDRTAGIPDFALSQNWAAYPNMSAGGYKTFYTYAIAMVALLAVLCIYIMQLSAETHSFAVLRSIGITRGQMARLLLTESMILCLPAVFLGIPCGVLFTWLVLELTMYSGSVSVQVSVPWTALLQVICLWVVMVLLTRLIVFSVTVRTPLTGQLEMQQGKFRRSKRVRSAFIVLLVGIFGAVTIYATLQSVEPNSRIQSYSSYPPYHLSVSGLVEELKEENNKYLTQPQMQLIKKVPGIREIEGYGVVQVRVAFDGMEIRHSYEDMDLNPEAEAAIINGISLYVIDETQWEDTFKFGMDREAFHNGELVLLCFPDFTNKEYVLPQGDIQICVYMPDPYKKNTKLQFMSEPVSVSIRWLSGEAKDNSLAIQLPYTVICSNAYMQKMLDAMEPKSILNNYTAGDKLKDSYPLAEGYIDWNIADLSTDIVMAELCNRNNIYFYNQRQEYMALIQEQLQTLILLCSSGVCIALMALLILYSALTLEAEQEKRYFKIMRIIGMSEKQMQLQIFGKAFRRSCFAVVIGWLFYLCYPVVVFILKEGTFGQYISEVVPLVIQNFKFRGGGMSKIFILSIICLLVPLILSLIAKRKLRKESWIS